MTVKQELARKAERLKEESPAREENKNTIRLLRTDEIECRIGTINEKGLSLLLFKDARVDQKLLDEMFTPFGWKRTHQSIDGNLYCTVEIWDEEKQQWIAKQDVGTTSYSEKEKGQASDSFKRACFNWGLGRELYTAPFIWISAQNAAIQKKGERYITYDRFSVCSITYNEQREIVGLVIVNDKGQIVFEKKQVGGKKTEKTVEKMEENLQVKSLTELQIKNLKKELERTGVLLETVLDRYQLQSIQEMTEELYGKALRGLKKTKTKQAA